MVRRRQGRASVSTADLGNNGSRSSGDSEENPTESESLAQRGDSDVATREKVFSWFDVLRAGAQLTLDVLRVVREASDLYRKLSSGSGGAGK